MVVAGSQLLLLHCLPSLCFRRLEPGLYRGVEYCLPNGGSVDHCDYCVPVLDGEQEPGDSCDVAVSCDRVGDLSRCETLPFAPARHHVC